jgi:hypothetical protein
LREKSVKKKLTLIFLIMPFTNFDSRHFSATEKTAVNTAITSLETALTPKLANLSADERL